MSDLKRHLTVVLLFVLAGSALAYAQSPPAAEDPAPEGSAATAPSPAPKDPYEAYEGGHFNQALQGFVDQQVRRPEDPEVALNLGSAHYQMGNYPEAERAFTEAANDDDPDVRFQGFYNLGNTAFRQGKLDEAVAFYQSALEVRPDDEDAKFNLEYTRDEIRRRHEEAQKRQQEQEQQQQGDQGQEQPPGDQGEQSESQEGSEGDDSQDSGSPGNQEQENQPNASQDEGGDQEQGGPQEQRSAGSPDAAGPDADDDGLPDQVEREGANPTDPRNPDTDQDGLPDGAEDLDRDGEVDPGETDPNRADSDGDGIPDGQDPDNTPAGQQSAGAQGDTTGGEERPLTAEEAARLLDSLEEGRPVQERPGRSRRTRPEKDW
ncbi:MAG: tetratricopeptide repeat protein [Acidobacteriota bacterium]